MPLPLRASLLEPPRVPTGFFLSDLSGRTADDKRESLYRTLQQHGWPDGYDGYMKALNEPQSPRPGRSANTPHMKLKGVAEGDDRESEDGYDSFTSEPVSYTHLTLPTICSV